MRVAVTADLHWGHSAAGDAATQLLVDHLRDNAPDLLLLGGDVGAGAHFRACLELFGDIHGVKALVPGNHDLWVSSDDARGDSWRVYQEHLPAVCAGHGFHYLDHSPLIFPELNGAVAGTINWYDYSWSLTRLQQEVPDWEWRLQNMAFTRGRHNDRRFVRWDLDDVRFTHHVVAAFERHLVQVMEQVQHVLVLTHHPALYGLSFPRNGPPSVPDGLLWDAFSGNAAIEKLLDRHAQRIDYIFSGHTHRAREHPLAHGRSMNIGGDYHFKRLVELSWPGADVEIREFGNA